MSKPITGIKISWNEFLADKYNCSSHKQMLVKMDFQYFVFEDVYFISFSFWQSAPQTLLWYFSHCLPQSHLTKEG